MSYNNIVSAISIYIYILISVCVYQKGKITSRVTMKNAANTMKM